MQQAFKIRHGSLTFEWIVLLGVLVISLIAGMATVRDGISAKCGKAANDITKINESYHINRVHSRVTTPVTKQIPLIGPNGTVVNYITSETYMKREAENSGFKYLDTPSASQNPKFLIESTN